MPLLYNDRTMLQAGCRLRCALPNDSVRMSARQGEQVSAKPVCFPGRPGRKPWWLSVPELGRLLTARTLASVPFLHLDPRLAEHAGELI